LAAGLIALLLTVIEPNLIAHGSLVTTDMAVTLAFLASVTHYFAGTKPAPGRASCASRLHWRLALRKTFWANLGLHFDFSGSGRSFFLLEKRTGRCSNNPTLGANVTWPRGSADIGHSVLVGGVRIPLFRSSWKSSRRTLGLPDAFGVRLLLSQIHCCIVAFRAV
jgi:hypothetical protein